MVKEGLTFVIVGITLFTVKVWEVEVPPPGAGLNTATEEVPAVAISLAGTMAVSLEELTKVVVESRPLNFTTESVTKLAPFAVKVNSGSPTTLETGSIESRVGIGEVA